jgi:serine/threonine protein kinase/tetratricopeptide (TPR) repeat protein
MASEILDEKAIFNVARQIGSPDARAEYLRQACGPDPGLRERVQDLLRAYEEQASFLESPPPVGVATVNELLRETAGTIIGPYKLIELIGEGGMGTVWMAQQTEPVKRLVALKLIKAGMDSKQVIARFEAERQALALMDHANIARVLDAGTTSAGRPYFVMDLVKGVPITRYCDEHHLTPRQRLELFIPVCQAVQHAHQKGIIHRDIKPSNVLVALYDGKPVPKVIDFGVAKAAGQQLTDKTLVTGFGNIVGTLEYMSPEQAEINQLDIDTRSDIYSLGVLLYELLAGSPPFSRKELETAGMLEMLRVIREQEPSKPSTKLSSSNALPTLSANRGTEPAKLTKLVRGELDWIVMKALEKDRNRRYETPNGFAMDVQRYLADEPVQACPPSAGYRLRKFARRNKGPVLAASLVGLALVGGIVGTTLGLVRAKQERKDAIAARDSEAEQRRIADEERAVAQAVNDFVQKDLLGQGDLENQPGGGVIAPRDPNIKVRTVLDQAAKSIERRFANQPRVAAAIHLTIAKAYVALGDYKKAQHHAERSAELRTSYLGPDHADTLASKDTLVWVYYWNGLYERAVPLNEEVLEKRTATLGTDHPDTLNSKFVQVMYLQGQREFDLAEAQMRELVQKQESRLGPRDSATLWSKNQLACIHIVQGKLDLAATDFIGQIMAYENTFGEDHPGTILSKSNLALVYQSQGKLAEAEALFREVLQKRMTLQGPGNPCTEGSKVMLGELYFQWQKYDQAMPLLEEGLAGFKASLGEDSPFTVYLMNSLARAYVEGGKPEFAVPLYERLLARHKEQPFLGDVEAFNTKYFLALAYVRAKMPERADVLFDQALMNLKGKLKGDDPKLLSAMDFVARGFLEAKQPDKALPLVREYLDRQRKRLGADNVQFAFFLAMSGHDLLKHKLFAEAEKFLRECMAIREKNEPEAFTTFNGMSMLGEALLGQKRYTDAEPLLVRGYEGMKQREAKLPAIGVVEGKVRLTEALERLVQLYDALDRPEEAARWRKELEAKRKPRKSP